MLAYAGFAVWLLAVLPVDLPVYRGLVRFWRGYEEFPLGQVWDWPRIAGLYLALPLWLYGPPTVLMGLSFGILQRAVHDDPATSGRKVGFLQAGNIVGNVAGSLVCGLLLLDLFGTAGTLRCLVALGLVFAALAWRTYGPSWSVVLAAAAVVLVAAGLPRNDRLWLRLHGLAGETGLVDEDATTVAAITPDEGYLRVSVNGKGHSWLPFGGIHSELGAVPALIHPAPRDVAIIGLGSGDTAWAAGCRPQTSRVVVYELGAPEERLLHRAAREVALPSLARFLDDPRVEVVTADGRNALARSETRYDLIEADALRPHSAYSGNVYSLEFFRLCARRLKPGGLMCSWAPTPRVHRTFCEAFPHVLELEGGSVVVGSNEPIEIAPAVWLERLGAPEVRAYLGEAVAGEVARALSSARPAVPEPFRAGGANRDLFPRDELRSR
jgi:hypothetical protein